MNAPKVVQPHDDNEIITPEIIVRKRKKTAGEKFFNRTVYTGIGFWANEIGSLIVTGQMERGIGKNWTRRMSERLSKTSFFKDQLKNGKLITGQESANNILMWFSLTMVGTALVWPMKALEDNKNVLVKKCNHYFDGMRRTKLTPDEISARDDEVERAIACESKQTWPTLILGRAASILNSLTLGYTLGEARTSRYKEATDRWSTAIIKKTPMKHWEHHEGFHYYARLLAPETIGCAANSVVMEVVSKFFARRKTLVKNPTLCGASKDTMEMSEAPLPQANKSQKKPDYRALHAQRAAETTPQEMAL